METWTVSDYMGRMERACLDIQEDRVPVEQTITLWWGLDGLRLAEDGSMEWVSRRAKKEVFPHPSCDTVRLNQLYAMTALNPQDAMRYVLSQQINSLQIQIAQGMQSQNVCQTFYQNSQVYPMLANPFTQCGGSGGPGYRW